MLTLKQSFDAFAKTLDPAPSADERKKLFTLYVDTYTFASGKTVNSGQEETPASQASSS